MKKIRLTESDLVKLIERVVNEQSQGVKTMRQAAQNTPFKKNLPKVSPKILEIDGMVKINGRPVTKNQSVNLDDNIEMNDGGKITFFNIENYGQIVLTKQGNMLLFDVIHD